MVLVDQGLAESTLELGPLFALNPKSFHLVDSGRSGPLIELLQSQSGSVEALAPTAELSPWVVESLGDWTEGVLLNGLTLDHRPEGLVRRPGLAHVSDLCPDQINALMQSHWAATEALPPESRQRARSVSILGGFEGRWRMAAIVSGIRRIGLRWEHAAVFGDDEARLTAFELAAVESVVGRAVRVQTTSFDGPVALGDLGRLVDECAATSLARRADDSVRIACFQGLALTRMEGAHSTHAEALVEATLGPVDSWIGAYRRHLNTREARLVVVPTWQCELRCVYCTIGKTGGKEMDDVVGMESLDLLFSAPNPDLCLAFFGGEPLLRWPLVRRLCDAATERARAEGRNLSIQLTTNAWALTEEIAAAMAKWNLHLQLSLDGDEETQNAQRKPWGGSGDSYERGPAKHIESMHKYGVNYQVIMVVTPKNVSDMARNFQHLIDIGARCVQLNYAIGIPWSVEAAEKYAEGLQAISERVEAVWAGGGELDWVNVRETVTAVRNNLHVTVDFDGSVYGGNAFLFQAVSREEFLLGELKDRQSWHRYMVDGRSDADVFAHWKRRATVVETTRVGSVVASFVRWMQARHPKRLGQHKTRSL